MGPDPIRLSLQGRGLGHRHAHGRAPRERGEAGVARRGEAEDAADHRQGRGPGTGPRVALRSRTLASRTVRQQMCAYETLSGDLAEATPGDGQARGHAVSRPRAASEEEEGASAASGQTGLSPAWRHWPAEANGGSASGSRASGRGQRGACPSAKFRLRFGSTVRSLQGTAEAPSLNHSSTLTLERVFDLLVDEFQPRRCAPRGRPGLVGQGPGSRAPSVPATACLCTFASSLPGISLQTAQKASRSLSS